MIAPHLSKSDPGAPQFSVRFAARLFLAWVVPGMIDAYNFMFVSACKMSEAGTIHLTNKSQKKILLGLLHNLSVLSFFRIGNELAQRSRCCEQDGGSALRSFIKVHIMNRSLKKGRCKNMVLHGVNRR
jgi:hypothetical protein